MKKKINVKVFLFLLFIPLCFLGVVTRVSLAQEDQKLSSLTKQVIEANSCADLYLPYERLKDLYLQDNKFSEFADFLKSLGEKRKSCDYFNSYYIALSRYLQLKYLEDNQKWDEYFSQGNTYRDELTQSAQKAIDATTAKDKINIDAKLLIWQFHKDQNDAFCDSALSDLMNAALSYSSASADTKTIKGIADRLASYGEKGKSKELYKIYSEKIISGNIKDEELKTLAENFYNDGNLDLSENIYDSYLGKISKTYPKEKLIPVLVGIARQFVFKDGGASDAAYAEKMFKKVEEIGLKTAFDQELMYLRAYNLEKSKEFVLAKEIYSDLAQMFPESSHADEALFKCGIIHVYVLRDAPAAKFYFSKLSEKENLSAHGASSLYQLGVLSFWEGDLVSAKNYFNKLVEKYALTFPETAGFASDRLKEVQEGKPLEFNLKTALDMALKEENSAFDMSRAQLSCHPYRVKKDEAVQINSSVIVGQSGCLQVELQYLWSGDLGKTNPSSGQSSFSALYPQPGTKVINLLVVSPSGSIDRALDMVDVE